jgi:uncharacterized protein (TIGR02118 family)
MGRNTIVRFLVLYEKPENPDAFDRHYRDVHIPLTKGLPGRGIAKRK